MIESKSRNVIRAYVNETVMKHLPIFLVEVAPKGSMTYMTTLD